MNVAILNYYTKYDEKYHVCVLEETLAHEVLHGLAGADHDDSREDGSGSTSKAYLMAKYPTLTPKWLVEEKVVELSLHSRIEIYEKMAPLMAMLPVPELFLHHLYYPSLGMTRYNCLFSEWGLWVDYMS